MYLVFHLELNALKLKLVTLDLQFFLLYLVFLKKQINLLIVHIFCIVLTTGFNDFDRSHFYAARSY